MRYPALAIETTGQHASVALKDENGQIYFEQLEEKLNHLKGLIPLMEKVLDSGNLNIKDVQTIAVSQGPGSFTGIRIGISTVRSIAQITGAKIIGVPTLETFVFNDPAYRGLVCPIFDARMEQMYAGAYILEENKINTVIKTDAYDPADYFALLTELISRNASVFKYGIDLKFFGDGLPVFENQIIHWQGKMMNKFFSDFSMEIATENTTQRATSVMEWAELLGKEEDYNKIMPVYIRKAEAQRRLDEKNACRD